MRRTKVNFIFSDCCKIECDVCRRAAGLFKGGGDGAGGGGLELSAQRCTIPQNGNRRSQKLRGLLFLPPSELVSSGHYYYYHFFFVCFVGQNAIGFCCCPQNQNSQERKSWPRTRRSPTNKREKKVYIVPFGETDSRTNNNENTGLKLAHGDCIKKVI